MKILIGVDGSAYSDAALDEVAQRIWPPGSEATVVTVYELPLAATPEVWALPPNYYEECERAVRMYAEGIKDKAVAKLKAALGPGLTVKGKTIPGSPKRAIIEEAETYQPDLIIVGSHGYPAWERLLLGSVSQAVVSHAKCSVEVVRHPHLN